MFEKTRQLIDERRQQAEAISDKLQGKTKSSGGNGTESGIDYGNKLAALPTQIEYMGGYSGHTKAKGMLVFYQNQTEFRVLLNKRLSFNIPNNDIADIAFEGKDDVLQQRTIARNILLAGKSKKQEIKDAYMTLSLVDGQQVMFHIAEMSPLEVKSILANAISRVPQGRSQPTSTAVSHGSAADELAKLARLRDQGILTEEEFSAKKKQLLGL